MKKTQHNQVQFDQINLIVGGQLLELSDLLKERDEPHRRDKEWDAK